MSPILNRCFVDYFAQGFFHLLEGGSPVAGKHVAVRRLLGWLCVGFSWLLSPKVILLLLKVILVLLAQGSPAVAG